MHNWLHHFVADTLADNYPMLRVMTDAGRRCARHHDGPVLEVDFDLDHTQSPEVLHPRAFGL